MSTAKSKIFLAPKRCLQEKFWPAAELSSIPTCKVGIRMWGRGSRKENENKPYPHPSQSYHASISSTSLPGQLLMVV